VRDRLQRTVSFLLNQPISTTRDAGVDAEKEHFTFLQLLRPKSLFPAK